MNPSAQIPRPAGSLLSHSRRFVKNTMRFYEEAFRECGDVFATRIPGLGNWVYVCSPELVKAVVEAPPDVLTGGDLGLGNLTSVMGEGAHSYLDGPAHRERRDVISPYLGAQAALRFVDDVRRTTEASVADWPLGRPFPLVKPIQKIALEALITGLIGAAGPEKTRQLAERWEDFSFKGLRSPTVSHPTFQVDFGPWSPWNRVRRRQREIVEVFSREIAARLAAVEKPEEDDLVLGMARARLADGSRLSADVIRAELFDLLFQGHELTGNSIAWTVGELVARPEVLGRLRAELDSVLGDEGVRGSQLGALPYLEAVVNEGLRFRPSNPFASVRRVHKPFSVGPYVLPEGTMVAVCFPALAKREDVFANPREFDPENFLGKEHSPYAWSPFGGGAHGCPGRGLAEMVIKVAVATIVRKARLKLAQDEVRPVRSAYFYEPNKGLLVTLEKRL
jgi:cytochrome P450